MEQKEHSNRLKYLNLLDARKAYAEGKNVTEQLRNQTNIDRNTPEIIEAAYDLQAGSYIEYVKDNIEFIELYTTEVASIINDHITHEDRLLDVGTGEITTLSLITKHLVTQPKNILAFDISWSRIYKGLAYAKEHMQDYNKLTPFVANIGEVPLLNKSVDVTISSHALEPNGGKELELISELFRITDKKLVLFEPCYEINSEEGKERMSKLGYIKNLGGVAESLGGTVTDKIKIKNVGNPLNPTVCYIITPPTQQAVEIESNRRQGLFSVPGTNYPLEMIDDFYFSNETGLCFPTIKSIPVLTANAAILASAFS